MAITVYWACLESEWMRAEEPEPIYKNLMKEDKSKNIQLAYCPAVKDYMHNTFAIKSIYDYEYTINKSLTSVTSDLYSKKFFDQHVQVRSLSDKSFSFFQKYVFFTEEKSLKLSSGIFPYLEDNNITKTCIPIPGTFDIGKWFRNIEYAFFLRNDADKFKINEKEIYQYIKFDTDEQIIFKQFQINENLNKYLADILYAKEGRKQKMRELNNFYSMFKHKKYIINEIKNNLI